MLRKLTVSNFAVVERVEVEFSPGLTVITGETGAGKSVLMGALGLVLGARADAAVVRDGAAEAEVEAEFDGRTVRRTVTREGRSRAWIDDESVSVAELKELGRELVDIHGPTANQRLMEEAYQREALDAYGHVGLGDYAARWAELTKLRSEFAALAEGGGADEEDMLRFQVNELDETALTDEDETLAERHAAAAHAEEIVENANAITEALGGDRSVTEMLIGLQPRFREIVRHLPAASAWAEAVEDMTVKVQELSRTVADEISRLDFGEEDLEELDRRLTLVNRLKRKYRVETVSDLLALREAKRSRLALLEGREERLEELKRQVADAEGAVRQAAAAVTGERRTAAERMGKAIVRQLRDLGFLRAEFSILLEPIEPEASGADRVVYMFGPNPGEAVRPLAAIASSGEVARVMLAMKIVTTSSAKAAKSSATLVFDEIDANVGGEIGQAVGEKLRSVAKRHQVIAITHLPQTAVFGESHLVVAKEVSGGRTRTEISSVGGAARVSEIARMLGGERITSVVRRHAEELLHLSS